MISVTNPSSYDFLPTVAIEVGKCEVIQMPGVPIFGDEPAVGIEDSNLAGIPEYVNTGDDNAGMLRWRFLQNSETCYGKRRRVAI